MLDPEFKVRQEKKGQEAAAFARPSAKSTASDSKTLQSVTSETEISKRDSSGKDTLTNLENSNMIREFKLSFKNNRDCISKMLDHEAVRVNQKHVPDAKHKNSGKMRRSQLAISPTNMKEGFHLSSK